jgi:hypothetical protein
MAERLLSFTPPFLTTSQWFIPVSAGARAATILRRIAEAQ